MGLPGSGKSTLCERLRGCGWSVVDDKAGQEEFEGLPPRERMEQVAAATLRAGKNTVVDRTNIESFQRAHWLRLAREAGIPDALSAVVFLNTSGETCKERVLQRENHRLANNDQSLKVVDRFMEGLTPPTRGEGFGAVFMVTTTEKFESFARDMCPPG